MKLIVFLALAVFILLFPKDCLAQSFSLSISPPILEVMIQPGKRIVYTFDLENRSPSPISLTARIAPFEAKDNQGHIRFLNEEASEFFSLLNANMSFGQPFSLSSSQKIQLVIRIAIPQNQPEGDYYQTILIEQSAPRTSSGNLSQSLGAVGANILLTVSKSGQPQRSLEIESFSIPNAYFGKIIDSFSVANFELALKNTGEAFTKPQGSIFIRPEKGKEDLQEIKIRPDNILPGTTRKMQCLEKPCFFKPPKLIGSYQACFEFVLDGKKYQSVIGLWVFPFKITIGIVLLLSLWLFSLWRIRQRSS
jgi:hypothetical protein